MSSQQLPFIDLFNEFTRHLPILWKQERGCFRPAHILYAIMTMSVSGTHGYRQVLNHLNPTVGDRLGWTSLPFPSSLSEAWRKLTPNTCREAFVHVRPKLTLMTDGSRVRYGAYRILAIDMTTLALPACPAVEEAFKSQVNNKKRKEKSPKATLTAVWDVSTNTSLDWKLEQCYASERFAAYDLIHQLSTWDLFIGDRGHSSRRMFLGIQRQGAAYFIRMPLGKAEGFRTNLFPISDHPADAMCDLYCHRWDIETAFREMKVCYGLENFHARFAEGIHQEVTALMIFMLLTAELKHQAEVHHQMAIRAADLAISKIGLSLKMASKAQRSDSTVDSLRNALDTC